MRRFGGMHQNRPERVTKEGIIGGCPLFPKSSTGFHTVRLDLGLTLRDAFREKGFESGST